MKQWDASGEAGKGKIRRSLERGAPVIWRFMIEMPEPAERRRRPWLVVISWTYDGSKRGGMPEQGESVAMQSLEQALRPLEVSPRSVLAYSRCGNGLKEFVFYTTDRKQFAEDVNSLLAEQPEYPLQVRFYHDDQWSDLEQLLSGPLHVGPAPTLNQTPLPPHSVEHGS